jgi:hypothetical protein
MLETSVLEIGTKAWQPDIQDPHRVVRCDLMRMRHHNDIRRPSLNQRYQLQGGRSQASPTLG